MTMSIKPEDSLDNLSIRELWDLLEGYYLQYFPQAYHKLAPPITSEELQQLETALKVTLPNDYKESLRVHNGQGSPPIGGLFMAGYDYINHEDVISEKAFLDDFVAEFVAEGEDIHAGNHPVETKDLMWSSKWIPITSDGHFAY
ncbi:unnamed protein product [Ambrosiozyma monospora]|uniref:Unnamed protein product n=1 Tax=Ambrosiozyma monospora TaxID=43982 RepID=A0ACB5UDH1_AMBMO|nr:unnamed protein product [Ambrosiozyma monospora]